MTRTTPRIPAIKTNQIQLKSLVAEGEVVLLGCRPGHRVCRVPDEIIVCVITDIIVPEIPHGPVVPAIPRASSREIG